MESHENKGRGGRGRGGKNRGGRGGKPRGRPQSRGRGGHFYPKKRGNSRNQNLDSNDWRFNEQFDENTTDSLRRETIENCSRTLIQSNALDENKEYTDEQIERIERLISELSIEDQTNYEFIVPMPPLDNSSGEKNEEKDAPIKKEENEGENPEKQENLNDWLDNLLG